MVSFGGDDKKKLMMAAGGGVVLLAIVAFVFLRPSGGGDSSSTSAPAPAKPGKSAAAPAPGAAAPAPGAPAAGAPAAAGGPPAGGAAAGGADASGATSPGAVPVLISATSFRPDPFKPFFTPTLPPPKKLPGPLSIPVPVHVSTMPLNLPTEFGRETGSSPAITNLPKIDMPDLAARGGPSAQTPPQVVPDTSIPLRDPNRRLSGVILGDSIYALVETTTGNGAGIGGGNGTGSDQNTVTSVVQPGDEIDGVKILRIEKVDDNGVQRIRMFVSDNGQERFFDLEPAPRQTGGAAAGGAAGAAGPTGGPPIRRIGGPGA